MTALKKELMLESIPSAVQYIMEVGAGDREGLGEFNKDEVLKVFSVGLYDDYSNWMTQGGYRGTSTKREFVKKLTELGLNKGNVRIGGMVSKGYTIKKADLLAAMRAYMRDDALNFEN
jgi:phage/plasmid-associated DNA primase